MKVAMVSTYPPRPCGIGVFAADLHAAARAADPALELEVVAIDQDLGGDVDPTDALDRPEVRWHLRQHDRRDYDRVARELAASDVDVVLVEHEFGIFGGTAGDHLVTLLAGVGRPVVLTLHTVLTHPSPAQASALRRVCALATLVTVFTETARRMVVTSGAVPSGRIRVVPHGVPALVVAHEAARAAAASASADVSDDLSLHVLRGRTVLSTFGLISSGKGIELAIEALAQVVPTHPEVLYLVAGQTHPEVVRHEGEVYREGLQRLVAELGLGDHVHFLDRFLTVEELSVLLASTDLYLTPYRSREQIVSGALTFAVAAGCPVVSTPYLYAEDLLASGAGRLVPFADPTAMAGAITDLLDHPEALAEARAEAVRVGSTLGWEQVARTTIDVLSEATAVPPVEWVPRQVLRLAQLDRLCDDVGIVQHADGVTPRWSSGYCTDDVARMVLVGLGLASRPEQRPEPVRMVGSGLAFLAYALEPGRAGLRNFMGHDRGWLDEPHQGDHVGRAAWALGAVVAAQPAAGDAKPALRELEALEPSLGAALSPRTVAYTLLGLARPEPGLLPASLTALLRTLATRLTESLDRYAGPRWPWFETYLTYDNARLPQALLAAGQRLGDDALVRRGLESLDWYAAQCGLGTSTVRLIGNRWRQQPDGSPAAGGPGDDEGDGDEQPLDAAALVEACVEAYTVTGSPRYRTWAWAAWSWFFGANRLGVSLYDPASGGCADGLTEDGVNENQGAESTLAVWQAALALDHAGLLRLSVTD
ncbi:glycosyltransferase [Microlunatus antarcticus]|uniref:Glycosyltransferase involved in cell wall biosynthesis n=1 Tax=Microlunatus antarcticus TaxID=53388 RepID=A0A7W5P8B2_9ACTN|nr:glycosyltransferase [Microlunatus antarcticus]MBB3328385.1 glycosyltransferase involved in cell wall biosynthesis [Microlunatus antarcticus]